MGEPKQNNRHTASGASDTHAQESKSTSGKPTKTDAVNFNIDLRSIPKKKQQITMSKLVVFGDGRTVYLNEYVQKRNNTKATIEVKPDPGAGIQNCISSAYQHVRQRPYDICVIMAGAQDMI